MKSRYSVAELAKTMKVSERTVQKRANKEQWPCSKEKVKGGYRKLFLARLLPDDVRLQLAAQDAKKTVAPASIGGKAGIMQGLKLARGKKMAHEQARIDKETGLALFQQLPRDKRAVGHARFEILEAWKSFLLAGSFDRLKIGTSAFCEIYQSGELFINDRVRNLVGKKLSYSSLNRWKNSFEALGMIGLANGYRNGKKRSTTLSQDHQDFVVAMLMKHPHSSIQRMMDGFEARFNGSLIPHSSSVTRYVKRWKKENASLYLQLTNPGEFKNKYQLAVGDASEQVEQLNQRWEFDSTPTDVMLVDGRHNLIGVIDVYTRRLKLLVSKTSRSTAVAAVIRRAIVDWGVPKEVKTDNGADYVSKHIMRVFASLETDSISARHSRPRPNPISNGPSAPFPTPLLNFCPVTSAIASVTARRLRRGRALPTS